MVNWLLTPTGCEYVVREDTRLSFDEYFWQGIDIGDKIVLDAGTGFGHTTLEIAQKLSALQQTNYSAFPQARSVPLNHIHAE